MPPLFVKLLLSILAAGVTAAGLLVIRQRQIDTVHEISLVHDRLREREQTLWTFQVEIARRCRPDQVSEAISRLGGAWEPLPGTGSAPPPSAWTDPVTGADPPGVSPTDHSDAPHSELGG